ncbi:PTB domain-containing engulfment adapter protein 1 isoform X1 [Osmerus eperlanus]|uniref:PTB domain-containing engulfment adapter protein 1 isoform X1 n=1 Tax=Osmerus eperlanus TaxID=29151 RepID=UPI002E0E7BD4
MNRAFNRRKDKTVMPSPESLVNSHITYNAKFLGVTEVAQPKGTDIVRVAVRKLKFQKHIRKSEGHKTPKVELQISIYGVKLLDPKTKDIQHNCQLHRISFCADDKTDKRIVTYICTEPESKKHLCYVFDSDKCAEEITVTIGRAFELAYRKFLESGGKDVETRKQIGSLQKRIQDLETENFKLKKRLKDLEEHLIDSPHLHLTSVSKPNMLQRTSSMFWCGSLTSISCLEMSSVSLTPASSPESSISTGLLTPPPSKPALLQKLQSGCCVPRPRAGSIQSDVLPTDVFDMVPFSSASPVAKYSMNGTSPPPVPPTPPPVALQERDIDVFGAPPFNPFICNTTDFPPHVQSKLDEMQRQRWFVHFPLRVTCHILWLLHGLRCLLKPEI